MFGALRQIPFIQKRVRDLQDSAMLHLLSSWFFFKGDHFNDFAAINHEHNNFKLLKKELIQYLKIG